MQKGDTFIIKIQPDIDINIVGWKGVITEDKGITIDGHAFEVNIYETPISDDALIPNATGVVIETNIEVCNDNDILTVKKRYDDYMAQYLIKCKQKAANVEKVVNELMNLYSLPEKSVRDIYNKLDKACKC